MAVKLMNIFLTIAFLLTFWFCKKDGTSTDNQEGGKVETKLIKAAIESANKLFANSMAGAGEGQFPAGSKDSLNLEINTAQSIMNSTTSTQAKVDSAADILYDHCMKFEAKVNSSLHDLIDAKATKETRYLFNNLKKYAPDYVLFGMHDATGYGVGWSGNNDRSDVKDVCGDFPAVFSWDANHVQNDADLTDFKYRILSAYRQGGVNTLCWHQYDPEGKGFYYQNVNYNVVATILSGGSHHEDYKKTLQKLARVLKSLRGDTGESLPIIFRPYHEHNGSWFWWGKTRCSELEFKYLWGFTVRYLRDVLGVHNLIFAFSPDGNQYESKEQYLWNYPGDQYVDVLGLDFYFGRGDQTEINKFQQSLIHAVEYAQTKNKLAALTEFGDAYGWNTNELKIDKFFTRCVLAPMKNQVTARNIAYAATWRNASATHHFAPYPGHKSVPDFLDFYDDAFTLFLKDLVNVYAFDSGL